MLFKVLQLKLEILSIRTSSAILIYSKQVCAGKQQTSKHCKKDTKKELKWLLKQK